MKNLIILVLLVISTQARAFLPEAQETYILRELNNLCGDAWCESSYDFIFKKLSCNSVEARCEIVFTVQGYESSESKLDPQSCIIPNIHSVRDLLKQETSTTGEPIEFLQSRFIDQISECLAPYIQ